MNPTYEDIFNRPKVQKAIKNDELIDWCFSNFKNVNSSREIEVAFNKIIGPTTKNERAVILMEISKRRQSK